MANQPRKVFISYSKTDRKYLEDAKKHLKLLERQNLIQIWDDTMLAPGVLWDATIRRELAAADIILFLVSADLIATDYIWDIEMTSAINRADVGDVAVVPVLIRSCMWEGAPFGKFTALPEKAKPVSTWEKEDDAWKQVVEKIEQICR